MKLLVTGAWSGAKENFDALEKMGHEVFFLQNENEDLPLSYEEVQGVVCNGLFLHHDIEKFKNLSYIQLTSAGFDRVPLDFVKEHGIKINSARGVYSIPMAEFTLAGVLSLYKKSAFFKGNQKKHEWIKNRELMELFGKNVLIVGAGSVGGECAKRFKAFGTKILAADIVKPSCEYYDEFYEIEHLKEALGESDIVILTLPLTDKTYHLFDEDVLGSIKKGAVLVNISRGAVIDEGALIKCLCDKVLEGAVLDVFEEEPLKDKSPLWDMENVIITPHNSFASVKNDERLKSVIIENMESWNEK